MTILCIDDEEIDLEAIRRILEREGFEVLGGHNYDDAMRIFAARSAEIELALLDVSLPDKTGVELANALVRLSPGLKILFISGYVGAEVIRMRGMSITSTHFLRKPFQANELVSRVQEVLQSTEPLPWANSINQREDDAKEADEGK